MEKPEIAVFTILLVLFLVALFIFAIELKNLKRKIKLAKNGKLKN